MAKQFMVSMGTYRKWYERQHFTSFQLDETNHIVNFVEPVEPVGGGRENPYYDERRGIWLFLIEQNGIYAYIPQHFLIPFT